MRKYYLNMEEQNPSGLRKYVCINLTSTKTKYTVAEIEAESYEAANKMMVFSVYSKGNAYIMQTVNNKVEMSVY